MDRIFGIDLGTTNSLIAYSDNGVPRVIADPETGAALLPSVVSFPTPDAAIVGAEARALAIRHPLATLASVKRFMGLGMEHVTEEDRRHYAFDAEAGRDLVRFRVGDRTYTPPEISALILKELKRRAEAALGETVRRVVITVPAYFNDSQRQATRDAGRLAGLEVLRLVNEPTAASLAYGLDKRNQGVIAVYDLGGGTFDISILRLQGGIFEVLATAGDTRLGGDDMDRRLARTLLAALPAPVQGDPDVVRQALVVAERAKVELTTAATATMELRAGDHVARRTLTRTEFETEIEDIVGRTLNPCRQALKDAGIGPGDLDEVVLVGGATRVPAVRHAVESLFGCVPHTELDPDQVVALGAAVQAGVLSGGHRDMLLLDVVPLSLGLETVGGVMERIVERNTTIPVTATQVFTTFVDNQTAVDFHVLQGERELVKDNRSLARFKLRGIAPAPAGLPRIEVTFMIDANGILNVTARDQQTGRETSIDVKPSYGLTDEQIEAMLEASIDHAEEDVAARLLIEARNDAEGILRHTRRALAQTAVSGDERRGIDAAVAELETAMAGTDYNRIRELTDAVNRATMPLAQRIMDGSITEALTHKRVEEVA
ncbi:Fe-S protein assembly chaperone HscA [Candidatus Binatia bacterium]|nr:Fe-S protein assembly chaperone HscA [Candidatus Binatia bacterium]